MLRQIETKVKKTDDIVGVLRTGSQLIPGTKAMRLAHGCSATLVINI